MALEPYSHYAQIGTQNAYDRWTPKLKFFAAFSALAGIGVALAIARDIQYPVLGAFAGGIIGYFIFRLVVYVAASNTADHLYRTDWCKERGMTYIGDGEFPANAPYAKRGDKREATDAYEGEWNGLKTLFYNFTYTEKGDSDDPDTDYDFKIMRLTGRELPIASLTMHQRGFMNKFKFVDDLQGRFTGQKPVSLESVAFNEKWDLTIDDNADEIWIRRIFDPATITALNDGHFTIPDVQYYGNAWWFVEKGHFKTEELEEWPAKQVLAADAVELLSRVQTL
ncbi:MAG: hypothetical protein JHC98_10485 [Thermoleophilaceae bacterium]|nr:hypothetical protein [Thermoleophilaceae bacterium]